MKIAAQLNGTDLHIFVEETTLKKITLPLNKELIKVELAVFITEDGNISHGAVSKPEPITDVPLMFCQNKLTLAQFKQKLKKVGLNEPYELKLGNKLLFFVKEFTGAYSINFKGYKNNQSFVDWLTSLETLEAGFLLPRLREGRRYFSRDFAEFIEFNNIEEFTKFRFELWREAVISEYHIGLDKAIERSESCSPKLHS